MGLYLTKVLCGKKGISMQLKKKSSISKPLVHKETTKKEKKSNTHWIHYLTLVQMILCR